MGLKQAAENAIKLEIPSDVVRVVGNDPVDVELRLHNHGDTTEDIFLTCTEYPWGWIAIPQSAINRVAPRKSESVTLRIFPPTVANTFFRPLSIVIQAHTGFTSAVLVETELMLSWITG